MDLGNDLPKWNDFLENLHKIGTKLPYMLDVFEAVLPIALENNDTKFAAEVIAAAYVMNSIIDSEEIDENHWSPLVKATPIEIDGKTYLFHDC